MNLTCYNIFIFHIIYEFIFSHEKGIYETYYYGVKEELSEKILNSIEIISNIFVRFNGCKIINFYELDDYLFDYLMKTLYKDKVIKPCNIQKYNHNHNIIMCIPSVIRTSNNPIDSTEYRTVFTHEERLEQTIKQLKSINSLNKDIQSYLIEGSFLNLKDLKELSKYSTVVLFCKDKKANYYSNISSNKSIYEVYCMKYMFENIY